MLEGAFDNVDGFRWGREEPLEDPVVGGGVVERAGSVLLRVKFERGGGESVDDGRKPFGFSLEVEGFGFNEEELGVDDCAANDEPYGLTATDTAGPPDMIDIREVKVLGGCDINSGHPSTSLAGAFTYVNKTCS